MKEQLVEMYEKLEDKDLFKILMVFFILGTCVSFMKVLFGGCFAIVFTIYGLAPYVVFVPLAYLLKSKWVAITIGVIVLGLDTLVHILVFFFPQDAQDAIVFVFTPVYFIIITIAGLLFLGGINWVIKKLASKM